MLFGATAALVRKDLQIFFSDARAVLLTLAVPIAIASFFGYVFSGPASGAAPAKIRIAVVDGDASAISKAIVERTAADPGLDVTRPGLDAARSRTERRSRSTRPMKIGRASCRERVFRVV